MNDMVEDANAQRPREPAEGAGGGYVGGAWPGIARRMIVDQQQCPRVDLKRAHEDRAEGQDHLLAASPEMAAVDNAAIRAEQKESRIFRIFGRMMMVQPHGRAMRTLFANGISVEGKGLGGGHPANKGASRPKGPEGAAPLCSQSQQLPP